MKRQYAILLSILLLLALFSACQTAQPPAAEVPATTVPPTEAPKTFEGCTAATVCTLDREDGICTAVVLKTADGPVGLLIEKNTPYEILNPDGSVSKTIPADGLAESQYHDADYELRVEGCVEAEKPGDLGLSFPANAWYKPAKLVVLNADSVTPATTAKPVIYLYPETETEVCVRLDYAGELTCTYPAVQNGWTVTAAPDGTLTDAGGQTYNYLYWEGEGGWTPDFSSGFCVPGAETAAFLEQALADLGLTRAEANEFIVYWLPLMQDNPWNLISFQQANYTDAARLEIDPAPDVLIRVCMAWQPLSAPVAVAPQTLTAPARTGFTVVEWGGRRVEGPAE